MVLTIKDVTKSFADRVILNQINLTIEDNDRIGLIGPNGAGKTTLLNIIAEHARIDSGDVFIEKKTSIGYLHQNAGLDKHNNIYDEMLTVFEELKKIEEQLRQLEQQMARIQDNHTEEYLMISEEYTRLSSYFEAREGYQIDVKIKTVLNGMGFQDKAYRTQISTLSGGEKTRLALAKLLLEQPTLLILDEPTNHLDFRTLMWLEDYLLSYRGSILVVSHDRYFLDKMVTKIWEVSHTKVYTYKGNYTKYKQLKQERITREWKEYEQQQNKLASMQEYVEKNIARASTSNSAKSRLHQMANMEILEKPIDYEKTPHFEFTFERDPVKDVLIVEDLDLMVGAGVDQKTLCKDIHFQVKRGEKIALIGRNGIGKSTLLKTILGIHSDYSGDIIWGRNVTTSFYEQENQNLNFQNTVLEELWSRFPHLPEFQIRGILGQMLISNDQVYKSIQVISGGERARLGFAIMVSEHSNTLIFDEPTNHLDLASKEALERALQKFSGTLIFVSHDRYFLNAIPTKIIEMTDDGLYFYEGNYDYYLEQEKINRAKQTPPVLEVVEKPVKEQQGYTRGKQQRSENAKRRNRIQTLEKLIQQAEAEIETLQKEIGDPKMGSNYELLTEKCDRLEEVKQLNETYMEEWLLLVEES